MTRIAVLSDSHGDHWSLTQLLERAERPDVVCFLGDIERDSDYLEALFAEMARPPAFYAVQGNNDLYSMLPKEIVFEAGGCRILMTHGHLYRVRYGTEDLVRRSLEVGARIALYGHTHEPLCEWVRGILVVNPGAAGSRAARSGRGPMGALIAIDGDHIRVRDIRLP